MAAFIPHLTRFAPRSRSARPRMPALRAAPARWAPQRVNVEYLAGLIPAVRRRLRVSFAFSDAAILASLTAIASRTSDEARWRAAEASTLGLFLLSHGQDQRAALITLLGLLPKPYH